MTYDTGYTSFWEMAKETTWGTPVTASLDVGLLEATGSISEKQNVVENYGVGSRKNNQLVYGKYGVSGSLTGSILNGRLLAYALGTDSPSGTGPTTHTLAQADTEGLSSFTLTQNFISTDKGFTVAGCKVNDFSLDLDTGGLLKGTYNWVGKDVTTITSSVGTRTAPTEPVQPSYSATVSWDSGEIDVKTFNFTYNNNLGEDEYNIGDRRRQALPEGEIKMNGSFVAIFSSLDLYNDFKTTFSTGSETGNAKALSFVATTGATTTQYELSLALTDVNLTELNHAVDLSNNRVFAEFSYIPKALGTVTFKDQLETNYIA